MLGQVAVHLSFSPQGQAPRSPHGWLKHHIRPDTPTKGAPEIKCSEGHPSEQPSWTSHGIRVETLGLSHPAR